MTIEEEALEEYPYITPSDGYECHDYNEAAKDGFIEGAEWMLDKAVKWLKENAQNYYEDAACHDNCWYDDEQMIEDFQKAMEE